MDAAGLQSCTQAGEGLTVEFKRCGGQPEDNTLETTCSFANRQVGYIFLGMEDDGARHRRCSGGGCAACGAWLLGELVRAGGLNVVELGVAVGECAT